MFVRLETEDTILKILPKKKQQKNKQAWVFHYIYMQAVFFPYFKDTFFCLYEKGGLHNLLQLTYSFPIPNIKGFSYLSDYECHKTPTLQPLPV